VKSNKQSRTGTAAAGSISPRQVRSSMASTCLTGTISTRMRGSGQGIIPDPLVWRMGAPCLEAKEPAADSARFQTSSIPSDQPANAA
jgi:hypothetical protein